MKNRLNRFAESERDLVNNMRNGIEWMQKGPYGIMVHFSSYVVDKKGNKKEFNRMADEFDVPAFMETLEKVGAKWLIFTITHGTMMFWSENPVIEKIIPGRCSNRDLMVEIADACKEKGIKFMLYIPTETDGGEKSEMRKACRWSESADKKAFMEIWMELISYYAGKLGDRLSGWWFDCAYESAEKSFKNTHDWNNQRFDRKRWFEAARAGNPDCKVALCRGRNDRTYVFFEQDYFAGECDDLSYVPQFATQDGIQHHSLVWIDSYWTVGDAAGGVGIPDAPRFTDDELYSWIKANNDVGGGVTLNIGIYNDGTFIDDTIDQLVRIKERLGN